MNAVTISLFVLFLVSLSLGSAVVSKCPDPSDTRLKLEENSTAVLGVYNRISKSFNKYSRSSSSILSGLEGSDGCETPDFPDDDPNKVPLVRSKRQVSLSRPLSLPLALPEKKIVVQVAHNRSCEPCPSRQRFLGRFYGNCYVIQPNHQQVRFVECNKSCFAPCMCSRSYCQRTAYTKVWFLSFCWGSGPFYGGYQWGLNFRYLWLPQDCTCANV